MIPKSLAAEENALREALSERCGVQVALCRRETTDSTMLDARRSLKDLTGAGFAVCGADVQTGDRGRQGRKWSSPPGGLYLTAALPVPCGPEGIGGLSLAVGASVAEMLDPAAAHIAVKWPNDLVSFDGRKYGGILIEVVPRGSAWWALVGIGVNVEETPPDVEHAAALHLDGIDKPRLALVLDIVDAIRGACARVIGGGFDPLAISWEKRDFLAGRRIKIQGSKGMIEGVAQGINPSGALIVAAGGRSELVHSGHVESY